MDNNHTLFCRSSKYVPWMRSIWLEYLCYLSLDHELYFIGVGLIRFRGLIWVVLDQCWQSPTWNSICVLWYISQWVVMDCQRTVDLGDRKRFSAVTAGRCNRNKPSDQNFVVGISFSNFISELIWTVSDLSINGWNVKLCEFGQHQILVPWSVLRCIGSRLNPKQFSLEIIWFYPKKMNFMNMLDLFLSNCMYFFF
jgi:hypothetical protein